MLDTVEQRRLVENRAIGACRGEGCLVVGWGMEHHVYFWLKEGYQNAADRAVFEQGLESLFEIGLVAGGRWAVPAKVMQRPVIDQSWTYALSMSFATVEDHDAYQDDVDHHAFINTFKTWWDRVLVMDLA